jgi:hypothetical protein
MGRWCGGSPFGHIIIWWNYGITKNIWLVLSNILFEWAAVEGKGFFKRWHNTLRIRFEESETA